MIDPSIKALIDKLIKRTEEKKVKWKPALSKDEYMLSLPSGIFTIWVSDPSNNIISSFSNRPIATFEIYNKDGASVGKVELTDSISDGYAELKKLYIQASDSATSRSQTLSSLSNDLDTL